MSQYDLVVIGEGAAGLSAALVLSRARRTVLVVDASALLLDPGAPGGILRRPDARLLSATTVFTGMRPAW